ncbi:MAG TPA: HAD family phosphatase [Variovorax sp.]|nr:HAD family phosphatase [Variovorax sp.]
MTLSSRRVDCILSDCDGVIVDSEVIADEVTLGALRVAFGRPDLEGFPSELVGRRLVEVIRFMEERVGIELEPDARTALLRAIDAEVAERTSAIAHTAEIYRALGLPVAVVSNSAYPRLHRSVERAGLLPLVGAHLYSAEDVGRPKPAPDGYLHAARRLGVAPVHCVVVEDSATGVRAARAAGMRILGFLGGSHVVAGQAEVLTAAGATRVFTDMRELPDLLAGLAREAVEPKGPPPA